MIVQMDNISAPSSRDLAQRLYDKNIEIENKRRRSVQARVPSDPNAWQQMRENFEAIVLEDHAFSEQHSIEYALWQMHYKRIEELRAYFNAALASATSTKSKGGKLPTKPDRITKVRMQLKTFLSEATGFYHDLMLKIRSKYGLPLGYFSDDGENCVVMEKGGKITPETKLGLISCHRCLIYLGDLARYKGLYAESDSKSRDYAAASSYYLQAASIWPSNGNPHHQLAILASYSSDELLAVYRYFRSLAVDNPFSTARDNLIVAFEKNRKSYSQLLGDSKAPEAKDPSLLMTSKGRGKEEAKSPSKDARVQAVLNKERTSSTHETYKSFCIQFVRLNGILFTHTSLETFGEVLSLVISSLSQLLSSGSDEELNFGTDGVENGLIIVRLVSILIYTLHTVNREIEGQSYAEILQRTVLLQNAFTAIFSFMGHILERCLQLRDPFSSYLLPGILVFVEWLACCPDVASRSDLNQQQETVRSLFWNHCISIFNKLLSYGSVSMGNEDESCFFNMSKYKEGETENCLALWEDFELRGFVPLLPAQSILDFSRKSSFGSNGNKEGKARVKRILAAGKVLTSVVRVNNKAICFSLNLKKFLLEPEVSEIKSNSAMQERSAEITTQSVVLNPKEQLYIEEEEDDDDEEIVFKPNLTEKSTDAIRARQAPYEGLEHGQSSSAEAMHIFNKSLSPHFINIHEQANLDASLQPHLPPVSGIGPQHLQPIQPYPSNWLLEQHVSLANGLKGLNVLGNGHVTTRDLQENNGVSLQAYPPSHSFLPRQSVNVDSSGTYYGQRQVPETVPISRVDIASSGMSSRRSPVRRPIRHLGPPPGFTRIPPKHVNGPISVSNVISENQLGDDYSWLDGYKTPSMNGMSSNNSINTPSYINSHVIPSDPFPGKHIQKVQFHLENQNGWQQHHQNLKHLKNEQQLQYQQQRMGPNQEFIPLPEQNHGNNSWTGSHFV